MSIRNTLNSGIFRKSVIVKNTRRLSILQQNQNLLFSNFFTSDTKSDTALKEIFKEVKKESLSKYNPPYQSIINLSYYIRKNRNNIEEIIKHLNKFLDEESLSEKIIVNII